MINLTDRNWHLLLGMLLNGLQNDHEVAEDEILDEVFIALTKDLDLYIFS